MTTDPRGFALTGAKTKLVVLLFLVAELNQHYVFPDTAKQIETLLRKRRQDGKYDAISNGLQFASQLTADMASVAHDGHMKVKG